jgi:hypothetical protein
MLTITASHRNHVLTLIGREHWLCVDGLPAKAYTVRRLLNGRVVQITRLRPDGLLALTSPGIVGSFFTLAAFVDDELKAFRADVDMGLVA